MATATACANRSRSRIELEFNACVLPPRLAWCLDLDDSSNVAHVVHGEGVVTRGDGFFEGAWAGDYADGDYQSAFMTGTGAKVTPGGLLFVTPNHSLDRLNVLRRGSVLYVSNSLPFLLARTGEELDARVLLYDSYVSSIRLGLQKYDRSIPTLSGLAVRFFYCCNALLDEYRELVPLPKLPSPAFATYRDYRSYLDETVASIVCNAADPLRQFPYAPLATVSRGYDSPAALAVAASAGCRQAMTFRESRGTLADEDCGTPVARHLGVDVSEFGRLDYRAFRDFPEIENSGGPNEFLSFGEHPRGALLFTGFHGDKLWDRRCDKVSRHLVRGDASGSSLTEYRLRVGFLHLPVPFIGADRHPELHAIANSEEMRPWSVGGSYDRPIARRIVEEAGVPRELFGQRKRAAGVVVGAEGLAVTLSERSFADFRGFAAQHWNLGKAFKVSALRVVRLAIRLNRGAARFVAKLADALHVPVPRVPTLVPERLGMLAFGYLGRESLLFHWGVAKLVVRYRAALLAGTIAPFAAPAAPAPAARRPPSVFRPPPEKSEPQSLQLF